MVMRNSIRQLLRTPLKTGLFAALVVVSVTTFTLGSILFSAVRTSLRQLDESFITIGTVEQRPDTIQVDAMWDSAADGYINYDAPQYSRVVEASALEVEGADYLIPPQKRPYYGALTDLVIPHNYDSADWWIIEARPYEDGTPNKPMRMQIVNTLYGDTGGNEAFWYCDHFNHEPAPLDADTTYVMAVQLYSMMHAEIPSQYTVEAVPLGSGIYSSQCDSNGVPIPGTLETRTYDIVYDGFYDTDAGRQWLALIESLESLNQTLPVVPTDATYLLMDFHQQDAAIVEGRDISAQEYAEGAPVCLVPQSLAQANRLEVGDMIPLPLYFANYGEPANIAFGAGWRAINFGHLNNDGESYPIFHQGEYTVVGIYVDQNISHTGYEMARHAVIIPSKAVREDDSENIVAGGPMLGTTTTFQIPNGTAQTLTDALDAAGIDGLDIRFYDNGYAKMKAQLDNLNAVAWVALFSGFAVLMGAMVFFSYQLIVKQSKRLSIERALGATRFHCAASLLAAIVLLLVVSALAGMALGGVLTDAVITWAVGSSAAAEFDTLFSSWLNRADKPIELVIRPAGEAITGVVLAAGAITIVLAVGVALIFLRAILKKEPMALLQKRDTEYL